MPRAFPALIFGSLLILAAHFLPLLGKGESPEVATAAAQDRLQSFQDALEEAQVQLRQRRYEEAIKLFKRANAMRNNASVECLAGLAQAYQNVGAHKNVVESCDKALALAGESTKIRAQLHNLKGVSLTALAGAKDAKKLKEAEAELRKSLELSDEVPIAQYNLGLVLLKQERDEEGVAALKAYLELAPRTPAAAEARQLIGNPRRARENFAPEFTLTTLQGEYLSSDDLRGKVVLLDFWATWCAPCVEAAPSLRDIYKRFSKEPFVFVGVSSDSDEGKWREFVAKNKMEWPQYLDRDRKIQRLFQIRSWPSYFVLDHEGIVRHQITGWGPLYAGMLEGEIKKALKSRAKAEKEGTLTLASQRAEEPRREEAPPEPSEPIRLVRRPPPSKGPAAQAPEQLRPEIVVSGSRDFGEGERTITRYFLSVTNWPAFSDELFASAPDLPPCPANPDASRTFVVILDEDGRRLNGFCALRQSSALAQLWFALPRGQAPPARVYIELRDRRQLVTYRSNLAAVPARTQNLP